MDKLANRIMLDALGEQGDARAAWEAIAYCTANGVPLPDWVNSYLAGTAAGLLDYLANRDKVPPEALPQVLGFVGLAKRLPPANPFHDPHEVYEEINSWVRSGKCKSQSRAVSRYSCRMGAPFTSLLPIAAAGAPLFENHRFASASQGPV